VIGRSALCALLALAACRENIVPLADHHQHLMSPAGVRQTARPDQKQKPLSAKQLVAMLDEAGIRRAVVLSDAYYFDGVEDLGRPDVYANVRQENDWTAGEVAQFPDRLVALCSFNPVADHALIEMRRCADSGKFVGLKLHFASTGTTITNAAHLERVRRVFRAANALRLPILAHVAAREGYGREHAEIIVNQILPEAPDIPVVIAHLWGGGALSEPALRVYADAISTDHPATKRLYFDLAQASVVAGTRENWEMLARRLRQIGLHRVYYASDGPQFGGASPRVMWKHFRRNMPLTDEEMKTIANNVAPFAQRRR
jgi:predicted TIM-barrel fold metal-dependent hydrolase